MARVRDPDGFAALNAAGQAAVVGDVTVRGALTRIAFIMAAKGGAVRDITVGDCLELLEIADVQCDQRRGGKGAYFYQLLHAIGAFPADAPPTVRLFSTIYQGSSRPTSSSTVTTWPAARSATCWWTTCANGSPDSTTPP